jgi:RNA polymerase sigma factor (sigma-70 family)
MNHTFSYKEALLNYQKTGSLSRELYFELSRLVQIVLRTKGISAEHIHDEIRSAFFEKLLKFKRVFYLKLELYSEKQARSFLAMTVNSLLIDYYRHEKSSQFSSLDAFEPYEQDRLQPEETWHQYRYEAQTLYQSLWAKLPVELQIIFCLVYNGGKTVEEVAAERNLSVGKVHKDKVRISQVIAPEASVEEVAQMIYRLIALTFCCQGKPC